MIRTEKIMSYTTIQIHRIKQTHILLSLDERYRKCGICKLYYKKQPNQLLCENMDSRFNTYQSITSRSYCFLCAYRRIYLLKTVCRKVRQETETMRLFRDIYPDCYKIHYSPEGKITVMNPELE